MDTFNKYQLSFFLDGRDSPQIVIRGNDRVEFVADCKWALQQLKEQVMVRTRTEPIPERTQELVEEQTFEEEMDALVDESMCSVHNLKMKEKQGKFGKFYSHSRGEYPKLEWCSGKGFPE